MFYLFSQVIVSWRAVANETHRRYGILIYATHEIWGLIATIAQINVSRINKISIDAKKLFFSLNCRGVKAKLKTRLRANGKAICQVKTPRANWIKTLPNEMAIRIYNTDQTGPKTHAGGDQAGLISFEYQLLLSMTYAPFIICFRIIK